MIIIFVKLKTPSVKCSAGTYRDSTMSSCTKCPENKIAEQDGATACTSCSLGQVSNQERTQCGRWQLELAIS